MFCCCYVAVFILDVEKLCCLCAITFGIKLQILRSITRFLDSRINRSVQ